MIAPKPAAERTISESGAKVLDVLNVLLGHFAHGLTPGEIAKATGLQPSAITRYVTTLEEKGFAERIPETGRVRPSHRLGRQAVAILRSLEAARDRIEQSINRLST